MSRPVRSHELREESITSQCPQQNDRVKAYSIIRALRSSASTDSFKLGTRCR